MALRDLGINRSNVRQVAAIGAFQALVGLAATASIGILVQADNVRDVGIVLVWLTLIVGGSYYLTHKPIQLPNPIPTSPVGTIGSSEQLQTVAEDVAAVRVALTSVLDRLDIVESFAPISAPPPFDPPASAPLAGIPALLSFIQQGERIMHSGGYAEDLGHEQEAWMGRVAEWLRADPGDEVAKQAQQHLLRPRFFRERVKALQELAAVLCTLPHDAPPAPQFNYSEEPF